MKFTVCRKFLKLILDIKLNSLLLFGMAEKSNYLSQTAHYCTDKSHEQKRSVQTPMTNISDETIIHAFIGYEHHFGDHLEQLDHEADLQVQEIEFSECLEFVVQLVDLFKHNVIMSELQCKDDWNENLQHQLKKNKGITGNNFLDHKVEKIALTKGLTKDQWDRLLYLTLTTSDSTEITKVSKKHLQKVHDMASRLLENEQQTVIFALINAIEKYMPEKYFTEH
jgi:hypothetical protein